MGIQAGFYSKFKERLSRGELAWQTNDYRAVFVDLNDYGVAITGATNATPIVVTANSHGLANGDRLLIIGVGGNTNANGVFRAANITPNTFELTDETTDANIAGNGAYTSGGRLIKIHTDDFLDDVPGAALVGTPVTIASKTVGVEGQLDGDDVTFTALTGDQVEALLIYQHTGTNSTSTLVLLTAAVTGLPFTPSGSNVQVQWDSGRFKIGRP